MFITDQIPRGTDSRIQVQSELLYTTLDSKHEKIKSPNFDLQAGFGSAALFFAVAFYRLVSEESIPASIFTLNNEMNKVLKVRCQMTMGINIFCSVIFEQKCPPSLLEVEIA